MSEHRLPMIGVPTAMVSGRAAYLLGELVGDDLVARMDQLPRALPPDAREEVVLAMNAIRTAGRVWAARRRNDETPDPRAVPSSQRISVEEAAVLLGVTKRRAQQLAPSLGGSKRAGRWWLDLAAVQAEAARRGEEELDGR